MISFIELIKTCFYSLCDIFPRVLTLVEAAHVQYKAIKCDGQGVTYLISYYTYYVNSEGRILVEHTKRKLVKKS